MRQNHGSKRSRGRSSNRRSGPPRNQTFDSNGPSIRIRGNAFQVHEKYLALARDASSAGDRIAAENYLQHAEHYFRIMAVQREDAEARAGAAGQQQQPRSNGNGSGNRRQGGENETTGYGTDGFEQPYDDMDDADEMPAFVRRKVAEPRNDPDGPSDSESETETAVGD